MIFYRISNFHLFMEFERLLFLSNSVARCSTWKKFRSCVLSCWGSKYPFESSRSGCCFKLIKKIHRTPLHLAALYGFTEAVQAILSKKDPGINMVDNDGRSPLHNAVISGSKNIVILLC